MRKFAVIGAGPIGGILGAHLAKAGSDVTLIDILESRISIIRENGLEIVDRKCAIRGDLKVKHLKADLSLREMERKPDTIFVCVKTYSLPSVIESIKEIFSPNMKVVSFQNGLDNEEILGEEFGAENVMRVVVNFAGRMLSDNKIEVTFFNKPNYIGVIHSNARNYARELADILTKCGLDTQFTEEIKKYEWEKAILNSCLAPVSAITGLSMEEIMNTAFLRELVIHLLKEGIDVARKSGINLDENFYNFSVSYLRKGGRHKPSMRVDIEAGRRTEIDFLNGKICEYGRKLGLKVPYNETMVALVKGVERGATRNEKN